jgi:hypothetical protein
MTSSHSRPLTPDDVRRLSATVEEAGQVDRDREPPLPPRRWRPASHALQQWRRNLGGDREPDRRV